jgi:L-glutamine-phosphate cytidylyltransferase
VNDTFLLSLTSGESDANERQAYFDLYHGFKIVRVIILAAGQGKRLLPLTADVPKALLDIGGKSLIERQIEAFAANGLQDFCVITGYGAENMEVALASVAQRLSVTINTIFNPFYAVADNLASCWLARDAMDRDFIQVNGDNVFRSDLVARLLQSAQGDIQVAINRKDSFDADDMKVMLMASGSRKLAKRFP